MMSARDSEQCELLHQEIGAVKAIVERLTAIVERLPKDGEGKPILPYDTVFNDGRRWVVLAVGTNDCWLGLSGNSEVRQWVFSRDCYPTREAEKKARAT